MTIAVRLVHIGLTLFTYYFTLRHQRGYLEISGALQSIGKEHGRPDLRHGLASLRRPKTDSGKSLTPSGVWLSIRRPSK